MGVAKFRTERRLAAILSADMVGHSRMMGADEAGTLARLKALRLQVIDPVIAGHGGRIVKLMGDGALVEFASAVDAVACAVAVQRAVAKADDGPEDRHIVFRIGVNLGDVIVEGDDIYGDGVNIAARLQEIADPGGVAISANAHEQVEGKLDTAFDDLGERRLKNIAKPVRVYRARLDGSVGERAAAPTEALALPDKPSIAVLPFTNMSGDSEQEYFSDGITEDIITALSHVRWLFVISSNSSFTYKGGAADLKRVADELGVRYVLEGSVRRAGNRVRISAQLIEARADHHIWAERFDRDLEDIFALQDEITDTIVTAIVPEVDEAERARAQRKPVASLDAWDLHLRGIWHMFQMVNKDQREAQALFRKAIELDPRLALAHAGLARSLTISVVMGTAESPATALEEAGAAARRAIEFDSRDAFAHAVLSRVHSAKGEFEAAIEEGHTATSLNPNEATAHYHLAWALTLGGRPRDAMPSFETALRLNPRGPETFACLLVGAVALIMLDRFEDAVDWARRSLRQNLNFWGSRAACVGAGPSRPPGRGARSARRAAAAQARLLPRAGWPHAGLVRRRSHGALLRRPPQGGTRHVTPRPAPYSNTPNSSSSAEVSAGRPRSSSTARSW